MAKVSANFSNAFCPQALFLYGTYKEDGSPNYGLFCWATYCWDDGSRFVACIGESKLTKDRIRAAGVFSATLVTENLLPAADYFGNNKGYGTDKSRVIESERGAVLDVPIPKDGLWSFELEVDKTCELSPESAIYVCKVRNLLADERLLDKNAAFERRLESAKPVATMDGKYWPIGREKLGNWGDWAKGTSINPLVALESEAFMPGSGRQ